MSTTAAQIRAGRLLKVRAWWGAAREALTGGLRGALAARRARAGGGSSATGGDMHPFDRMHGVDTSGLIYADGLSTGHEHDIHSAGYYATAPSLFHAAIKRWSETLTGSGRSLSDFSFVDVGCGKGRVVMLAAGYPFREIEGVELNVGLAAVARKNLVRWMRRRHACRNVRILCGDALATPIADGPVVLFFFNSFEREMVRMWLERLVEVAGERTGPGRGPIDVIYLHPEHAALFERTPGMEVVADDVFAFSAADAAADVFQVTHDRCAIYRLAGGARTF